MTRHNAALNHQRDLQHAATVNAAVSNSTGADTYPATEAGKPVTLHTDPADARQLRGIPAIGGRGSMGGHIPGTRPDHHDYDSQPSAQRRPRR